MKVEKVNVYWTTICDSCGKESSTGYMGKCAVCGCDVCDRCGAVIGWAEDLKTKSRHICKRHIKNVLNAM